MAAAILQSSACVGGLSSFALSGSSSRPRASQCCSASVVRGGVSRNSRLGQSKVSTASFGFLSSSITETRLQGKQMGVLNMSKGAGGGAVGTVCSLPVSPETLRWVFVVSASALLFLKDVSIPKTYLIPVLALEVPREALSWMKSDYGFWTAFLALTVKLFYHIPDELRLPLYLLLLVITAPFQLTQYRGSTPAAIVTLAVSAYVAYKHFSSTESLKGAFKGEKILPSIASVILVIVPILYLVNGAYY